MKEADKQYEDYAREREFLSKIEQSYYGSYEKAIITLSAAFLAFSLSFLGLVKKDPAPTGHQAMFDALGVLVTSWVLFAVSVQSIVLSFIVSALAVRRRLDEFELVNEGKEDPNWSRKWAIACYSLYAVAGVCFLLGIVTLVRFCYVNLDKF